MTEAGAGWRRALARKLTRRARMPASEAMQEAVAFGGTSRRIGITGPPGAGKSSLIARLAAHWVAAGDRVGVLAIDPSSPLSGGSLLGDRIRMDEIADDANIFIRSLSSGVLGNGLCRNVVSLLDACEQARFDHLVLETVGVGQVSHEAKPLVDTFALVLVPESGDTVQAMKAGILEVADVYVVNKADRPEAELLASELRSIAMWRGQKEGWVPPVVLTSARTGAGVSELVSAMEAHRRVVLTDGHRKRLEAVRRAYHLRSILIDKVDEIADLFDADLVNASTSDAFRVLIERLGDC